MASRLFRSLVLAGLLPGATLPVAALTPAELAAKLADHEAVLLVDVRPAHTYAEGHIPGAINIPLVLLPHKPLPASMPVVVYTDGLGQTDDAAALAAASAKKGVKADVLEGGYAAWLAETRLSTQPAGVSAERLPVITYDQLAAGTSEKVVLVDLRGEPAAKAAGARAMAMANDEVADFAARLGASVVQAAEVVDNRHGSLTAQSTGQRQARALTPAKPDSLLVLVGEDEAEAAALARQLRASGQYRFTVLVGGVEAIRHQGRTGLGRMDGRTGATQP